MPALTQVTFHLPNPLAHWPWSRKLNPHYGEVKPESDAWLRSFETLDAKSQRSFDRCNFCKYFCFVFAIPTFNNPEHPQRFSGASHIHLLTKVIFTNLTNVEVPNRCPRSSSGGLRPYDPFLHIRRIHRQSRRKRCICIRRISRRCTTESPIRTSCRRVETRRNNSAVSRGLYASRATTLTLRWDRFWLRAMQTSCASAQERFITSFTEYAYAVIDEASDRANGSVRTIKDYLRLTRLTAGPYPCFFPLEMDLDIPDEVMTHPSLEVIRSMAAESLVLGNVSAVFICSTRLENLILHHVRICTRTTLSKQPDMAAIISSPWS